MVFRGSSFSKNKGFLDKQIRWQKIFIACLLLLGSSSAFAAGAMPHFFVDLSALFVASALIAYVCFRFGLTPIIGFLIAGLLIALGVWRITAMG